MTFDSMLWNINSTIINAKKGSSIDFSLSIVLYSTQPGTSSQLYFTHPCHVDFRFRRTMWNTFWRLSEFMPPSRVRSSTLEWTSTWEFRYVVLFNKKTNTFLTLSDSLKLHFSQAFIVKSIFVSSYSGGPRGLRHVPGGLAGDGQVLRVLWRLQGQPDQG